MIKPKIFFVSKEFSERALKIVSSIDNSKFDLTVVTRKKASTNSYSGKILKTNELKSAEFSLLKKSDLLICQTNATDDFLDKIFLNRTNFNRICIDIGDFFHPSLISYLNDRFNNQKLYIDNSDGIITRDFQYLYLVKNKILKEIRSVLYPEPCFDNQYKRTKFLKKNKVINIVSIGMFTHQTNCSFDSSYDYLPDFFEGRQIKLHILPHPVYKNHEKFKQIFANFYGKKNTIVHHPMSLKRMYRLCGSMDVGIVLAHCQDFFQYPTDLTSDYIKNCFSGRISNYLDLEIPVICNPEMDFNYNFLAKRKCLVSHKSLLDPNSVSLVESINDIISNKFALEAKKNFSIQIQSTKINIFLSQLLGN